MLREYFSLCITENGLLSAIPLMIKGYIPNMEKLPDLLWRLGSEVCFCVCMVLRFEFSDPNTGF